MNGCFNFLNLNIISLDLYVLHCCLLVACIVWCDTNYNPYKPAAYETIHTEIIRHKHRNLLGYTVRLLEFHLNMLPDAESVLFLELCHVCFRIWETLVAENKYGP